jgi:hypothetical protein
VASGDKAGEVVVGRDVVVGLDTTVVVEDDDVDELDLSTTVVVGVGCTAFGLPSEHDERATTSARPLAARTATR